jgi:hypothetical protein
LIAEKTLVDRLAELYPEKSLSQTVVDSALMNRSLVIFHDRAYDNWHSILREAKNQRKLKALVDFVSGKYPDDASELQSLLQKWDRSTADDTKPAIPAQPKEHAPPDPDVHIGRELHWDRELVASIFVDMIKQASKSSWRVLGLQGSQDADLDSLVLRFEEMCRKIAEPASYPRIFAKVLLRKGLATPSSLALEILNQFLRNTTDPRLRAQKIILEESFDKIAQSSPGTGLQSLSDIQLSRVLTRCFEDLTQNCSVVLLLQRFEELPENTAKWLRDEWLTSYAWTIERFVTVVTGETLNELTKLEPNGIYCPDRLPPMTWQDFFAWARESTEYHFDWFTEDLARKYHQQCNGNPQGFRGTLKTLKTAIDMGIKF